MADVRICSIPGCGKPMKARGWCLAHYKRWRKHGSVNPAPIRGANGSEPLNWLNDCVSAKQDDCLIWPYAVSERGYGKLRVGGATKRAHRVVCMAAHGKPPNPNAHAAHRCGQRLCCNPAHLYWANASQNQMDRADHGTSNRGRRQWMSKLSNEQVLEICDQLAEGCTQEAIAERYGVTRGAIKGIATGANWGWLTGRG